MKETLGSFRSTAPGPRRPGSLAIGLVNNTCIGGLAATQDQFTRLLQVACPNLEISVGLFRSAACRSQGDTALGALANYANADDLFSGRVDMVIVTGMEPSATSLEDEPVWGCLTRIVDRAQEAAVPVIWSCLAAHAAVLHLDGIRRSRLPAKLSGVFECEAAANHPLAENLPARWSTPHSRYNGVSEAALVKSGYEILSSSRQAGVDSFTRSGPAPFLFCQGHPEYASGTLAAEYTRDVRRYLMGQRDEYPLAPRHFFDARLEAALDDYRGRVLRGRREPGALREVLRLVASNPKAAAWHRPAEILYASWIAGVLLPAPDRHPAPVAAGLPDARHPEPALLGGY